MKMKSRDEALHPDADQEFPQETVLRLACSEVWGGNNVADQAVDVPGLRVWVHSKPLEPATFGGDVYYLSVCFKGLLSRVSLADVAGHGQLTSKTAGEWFWPDRASLAHGPLAN